MGEELTKILGNFDFRRQKILPTELLEALRNDPHLSVYCEQGRTQLTLSMEQVDPHSSLGHIKGEVPSLAVVRKLDSTSGRIFYDQTTGERLGNYDDWL